MLIAMLDWALHPVQNDERHRSDERCSAGGGHVGYQGVAGQGAKERVG